ncbi:TetR/AcrR family transcriptional regulator [Microbacterium murale]|nr:TetR/AcrR family transcriptional regulator [Microbacterium murale]
MAGKDESAGDARAQPRRQARGQQRIELILHAAAAVFARDGYDSATTNAIAAEAGISPGSLYQYFKNKGDIAHALAEHYALKLTALRGEVFATDRVVDTSLPELVDTVLGPLMAFNLAHPGFKAIFSRTDMPAGLREAVAPIQASIHQSVAHLLGLVLSDHQPADVARIATVVIQLVRGMVPLITDATGAERDALMAELRSVLLSYVRQQLS